MRGGADIARQQVHRLDAIRAHRRLRRNMIVETSVFVVGKNEGRVLPVLALHEPVDQRLDVLSSQLNIGRRRIVNRGMLIKTRIRGGLELRHLGQCAILQIGEVLRDRCDVIRILRHDGVGKGEVVDVAQLDEARRLIRRSGAAAIGGINVNLPGDSRTLQFLKDRGLVELRMSRWRRFPPDKRTHPTFRQPGTRGWIGCASALG